jgi:predicted AAA+ superfamily ATPase
MSINTVMNYLKALENAFIIHRVSRYDIIGKKRFEVNDKYYFEDIGIRNAIVGFQQQGIEKILENVLYKHLRIKRYKVYVGKYKNLEIDFMCCLKNNFMPLSVIERSSSCLFTLDTFLLRILLL